MMYMGSKNRIAKHLLPVMLEHRTPEMTWVEPFVGGGNMIDKVEGPRVGNDIHTELIKLLEKIRDGWVPPSTVTREEYYLIKSNPEKYSQELVGFVGFLCSFGGKWWGGYAFNKKGTNYAEVGKRSLLKQAERLKGIIFSNKDYRTLEIPVNSIIYCDPPYKGTTKYKDGFNHEEFWEWCVGKSKEGHKVFISEYSMPDYFNCIAEINTSTALNKNKKEIRVEKLYTV